MSASFDSVREEYRRRTADDAPRTDGEAEAKEAPDDAESGAPDAPTHALVPALSFVPQILDRVHEPWVPLTLPGGDISHVRAGGTVVIMGPTGIGKTSLVAALLLAHARDRGPSVLATCELPGDEVVARAIGLQCEASWQDVLQGNVPRSEMERVLPDRFYVIEREHASLDFLDNAVRDIKKEHPGLPVLAAIDYVQIVPSDVLDQRVRVSGTVAEIDAIARDHRIVILAVNQMGRASSRAARSGENVGADTIDGAAESAAVERWATLTLTLGGISEPNESGRSYAQMSIGKSRMGGGDRVLPMEYDGRTGRWRIDGEARPAADVRAEAKAAHADAKTNGARLAIIGAASKSKDPVTREELRAETGIGRPTFNAGLELALADGEIVEVRQKKPRACVWLLWTPERAAHAGIPLVDGVEL